MRLYRCFCNTRRAKAQATFTGKGMKTSLQGCFPSYFVYRIAERAVLAAFLCLKQKIKSLAQIESIRKLDKCISSLPYNAHQYFRDGICWLCSGSRTFLSRPFYNWC